MSVILFSPPDWLLHDEEAVADVYPLSVAELDRIGGGALGPEGLGFQRPWQLHRPLCPFA